MDVGIEEQVFVSHPDADTVIWELDIKGMGTALDFANDVHGFLRLRFNRSEYEADLCSLISAVQVTLNNPVPVKAITQAYGYEHLHTSFPEVLSVMVEKLEPGDLDCTEDLLDCRLDGLFAIRPVFPANTLLEVGFFPSGKMDDFLQVNGTVIKEWPTHYFTRWAAHRAFKDWVRFVQRGWTLSESANVTSKKSPSANSFFLLHESDRASLHKAGRHFVETLQACFDEGRTALGVTVRYVECEVPAADSLGK